MKKFINIQKKREEQSGILAAHAINKITDNIIYKNAAKLHAEHWYKNSHCSVYTASDEGRKFGIKLIESI